MKEIKLGGKKGMGKAMLVDDDMFNNLNNNYSWVLNGSGYAVAHIPGSGIKGRNVRAHHLIIENTKGMDVDHINGDGLDNRRSNLRVVTRSQNLMNAKKRPGYSIFKGVCWYKPTKKFKAQITKDGKHYNLGYFLKEIHAAMTYDIFAKELFGKYAKLNFPL